MSLELVKQGAKVLIMGSSKDTEISNEILALSHNNPQIIDLCGKTNLVDVVDILGACQYVISNDSGLMHVACSVGARVIAIFGSSSPNYTPPLSNTAQIIQHQLSCSPCFQRKCEFGHYNCLQLIKPQQVLSLIKLNTKQFY